MVIEGYDYDNEVFRRVRVSDEGKLVLEHYKRMPHYVALPHGVNTAVWTPASGASIHVTSILVSVESAGLIEIFHDNTLFMKMHFNEKRAVPIGLGGDLTFDADVVLKATFTADNATDSAYITAVGHGH